MRKKLFFILLATLCCNGLFAQYEYDDSNVLDDHAYRVSIGPKIGVGLAFGSHSDAQDLSFSPSLCYQGGIVVNAHFGRRFEMSEGGTGWLGLQLEAMYGANRLKLGSQGFGINCIEVPVLAQLYVTPTLAVEAGVTMVKMLSGTPTELTYDGATYSLGEIKGGDVTPTVGICYKNPSGIMIDARYNLGLSPLAGNFDTKVSSFVVSFAYLFNIVK